MPVPGSCCSFSFLAPLSLSRHVRRFPGRGVGDVSADLQRRVLPALLLRLVNCVSDELLRRLGMEGAEFNCCHPFPLQRGVGSFAGSCRGCLGLLSCGFGAAVGREWSEESGVNACTPERQR